MARAAGLVEHFMVADHVELDGLLAASERDDGTIDEGVYPLFRERLLRHIAMEEKVLLPLARAKRGGDPLPIAFELRRDHSEIAKLLVRSPSAPGIAQLRELLGQHNAIEEGPGGLYASIDDLMGDDASGDEARAIVERLKAQPRVPLAPYYDGPPHRHATRPHR